MGTRLDSELYGEIVFIFLDERLENAYQLKMWLQTLQRLSKRFKVKIVYGSEVFTDVIGKSGVDSILVGEQLSVAQALYQIKPKVLLYPNQNPMNHHALRYSAGVHIFISHGESDKVYMTQNSLKKFDLYFAAGGAAIDRVKKALPSYNANSRIIRIGRPQNLDTAPLPKDLAISSKKRILYAPTWEGVTRATNYSSIPELGLEIVRRIIATNRFQLVYRPHPLSGTRDPNVAAANEKIRTEIERLGSGEIAFFDSSTWGWHLGYFDLLITDISAIAYDWLATGRGLLVTRPKDEAARFEETPLMRTYGLLSESRFEELISEIDKQIVGDNQLKVDMEAVRDYYFDSPKGVGEDLLTSAIESVLKLHQAHLSEIPNPKPNGPAKRSIYSIVVRRSDQIARRILRFAGPMRTEKVLEKCDSRSTVFAFLSSSLNRKNFFAALEELLARPDVKALNQIPIVINQPSLLLGAKRMLRQISPDIFEKVRLIPATRAADCEAIIAKLGIDRVIYLRHDFQSHMMIRISGPKHELLDLALPAANFIDHTLIMYDAIYSNREELVKSVSRFLPVAQPELKDPELLGLEKQ